MAFGKIFWKNEHGEEQEYLITRPDTGIGRAPANDIHIEHPSLSRYHARLQVANGGVMIVDLESSHGTTVNGKTITAETPAPLHDGDQIAVGSVEMRFAVPAGRQVVSLTPSSSLIEDDKVPFAFTLDEPQQTVAPGARLQLEIVIENRGAETRPFRVTVGGLAYDWVSVAPRSLVVDAGRMGICTLTIKPPRTSDTRPGRYALTVRVEDELSPKVYLETVREIDIAEFTGFGITAKNVSTRGEYRLALQNYGNVPCHIRLKAEDTRKRLQYAFEPETITLASGGTGSVELVVTEKKRRFFGAPTIPFRIIAQSQEASSFQAPLSGNYTPEAQAITVLKYGGIATLIGVGLALVLAVIAFILIDPLGLVTQRLAEVSPTITLETDTLAAQAADVSPLGTALQFPEILSFTVEPAEIIYRTSAPVTFRWDVDNFSEIALINWQGRDQLTAADISTARAAIDGADLPTGNIDFTLRVWDENGSIEEDLVVKVRVIACRLIDGTSLYTSASAEEIAEGPFPDAVFIFAREPGPQPRWAAIARYPEDALISPDLLTPLGWAPFEMLICDEAIPLDYYTVIE